MLLTEKVLDAFEQRGIKPMICLSYDGVGQHDWMRGVSGAEEATLAAIRACVSRGFTVAAAMCIHNGNKDTLRSTVNILATAGVSSMKVSNIAQTPLWRENADGNDMDIRAYYKAALEYIPFFFQDGMPMNVMLCSVIDMYKKSTEYSCLPQGCNESDNAEEKLLCSSIRSDGYIAPDGKLIPCMGMVGSDKLSLFPNILETGLKAALSDSFYMDYISSRISDLMEHNAECRDCPYVRKCCAGCRANALLGPDHDLWAPDRNLCILWKEGYVDRIMQVTEQAIQDYVK